MALYEARRDGLDVRCLVTFAPPRGHFLAHPLPLMQRQARVLALQHHIMSVAPPFAESYQSALKKLREDSGIDCVITGDIAEVDGYPNWIRQQSHPVGIEVHTPLWSRPRSVLLQQLLDRGFRAVISCVDTRRLDEGWVGRVIDAAAIDALGALARRTGLDICGENGEYHTLVFDAPGFRQPVDIPRFRVSASGSLAYMGIEPPVAE